jgi:antitoxin Phd
LTLPIPSSRSKRNPAAAIRNRRGEEPIKVSATEAKNRFGELLDMVLQSGMALITRHETPKAVLLSMGEYGALSRATRARLDSLGHGFDALLAPMQTGKARAGMKAAFAATQKRLGKAAGAAARRRT